MKKKNLDGWFVTMQAAICVHPKILAVNKKTGPRAGYLYLMSIYYSSYTNSDGFISEEALAMLAVSAGQTTRTARRSTNDLVNVKLFEEVNGGWMIHDFSDYQTLSNERAALREKRRNDKSKAGKIGAEMRKRAKEEATEAQQTFNRESTDCCPPDEALYQQTGNRSQLEIEREKEKDPNNSFPLNPPPVEEDAAPPGQHQISVDVILTPTLKNDSPNHHHLSSQQEQPPSQSQQSPIPQSPLPPRPPRDLCDNTENARGGEWNDDVESMGSTKNGEIGDEEVGNADFALATPQGGTALEQTISDSRMNTGQGQPMSTSQQLVTEQPMFEPSEGSNDLRATQRGAEAKRLDITEPDTSISRRVRVETAKGGSAPNAGSLTGTTASSMSITYNPGEMEDRTTHQTSRSSVQTATGVNPATSNTRKDGNVTIEQEADKIIEIIAESGVAKKVPTQAAIVKVLKDFDGIEGDRVAKQMVTYYADKGKKISIPTSAFRNWMENKRNWQKNDPKPKQPVRREIKAEGYFESERHFVEMEPWEAVKAYIRAKLGCGRPPISAFLDRQKVTLQDGVLLFEVDNLEYFEDCARPQIERVMRSIDSLCAVLDVDDIWGDTQIQVKSLSGV